MPGQPVTKADLRSALAALEKRGNAKFQNVDQRFEKIDRQFEKIDQRFSQMDERIDRKIGGVKMLVEETNARIRVIGEGINLLAAKHDEHSQRLDSIEHKLDRYTPLTAHGALEKRVTKLERSRP